MPHVFRETLTQRELMRRVGSVDQVAGIRLSRLEEGASHGQLVADFRTGSGLNFTVCPDRGMDIIAGDYQGIPLCWRSPTGDVAPAFYEPEGLGFLRSFCGGILATCGFTYVGSPCVDGEEELGLHGRATSIPARNVMADTEWDDDECVLLIGGTVREASVFGPNITLRRTIGARLGDRHLSISDTITNEGFETQPHMLLYHFNLGWPLVSEHSVLIAPAGSTTPRDGVSPQAGDRWPLFDPPTPGFVEQVFYHDMDPDEDGDVVVALVNPRIAMGVQITYRKAQLPRFVHWRMCGEGHYVCGLEPSNCFVGGRAEAREKGELEFIEPGETREYDLEFGVIVGEDFDELLATIEEDRGRRE